MKSRISKIPNNVQDRNSLAWEKLCQYVDKIAENGTDEFVPREALGDDLFSEIYTLPESIAKLKKVKKIGLYGSNIKRIPPEIGDMESLEFFDPYCSYDLHWFPYEITKCKKLKDSRISTRALYGNYKNRMGFPRLNHKPVKYLGENLKCSVCEKEINNDNGSQMWITLYVGTDAIPMLVNLCSKKCELSLPVPPKNYIQFPHKGGVDLVQPLSENELWEIEMSKIEKNEQENILETTDELVEKKLKPETKFELPIIKLIKKIWDK